MNLTAEKLREAADYMKGEGVTSLGAIIRLHEMFDVADPGTAPANLGAILDAIADELDELDDKATRRRSHIVQLESTITERNREMLKLRGQIPSERERQILDMWPRYEDGAYVWFGDRVGLVDGGDEALYQVHVGETGYSLYTETHDEWHDSGDVVARPVQSVLDADGVEIEVGDTVYAPRMYGDNSFTVSRFTKNSDGDTLVMVEEMGSGLLLPSVTHTRPDSWGRLAEDAAKHPCVYAEGVKGGKFSKCSECPWGNECDGSRAGEMMARDVIRRAKALAGTEVE